MTLVQRLVGMLRQVLFCGFLSDEELGRWSLAFNFLMLAAPMSVLGIPGSLGRYVEHYRSRNQLRSFLRYAALGITLPSLTLVLFVLFAPELFSKLLFNDGQYASLVRGVAVALGLLIVFNCLTELLMAMRLVRAATITHFVNSLSFTFIGLAFLWLTTWQVHGLIYVFIASTLLSGSVGLWLMSQAWRGVPKQETALQQSTMWRRVLPYAGWVWVGNLAANLFEMADQFLIKHWTGVSPLVADAMLGQYYTSRVVPNVMMSVAVLLGGSLLPYLVADWEAGRRDVVSRRVNSWLKLIAVGFTFGGAVALWISPPIFAWAFEGKFAIGISLLPWTIIQCVWLSMATIAQRCLACAERSHLTTAALCISLSINVIVNLMLLPVMGLWGAVLAAAAGSLADLLITFGFNRRFNMRTDLGVWVATVLPISLSLGPGIAVAITSTFVLTGFLAQGHFLSADERSHTQAYCQRLWRFRSSMATGP